MLNSGHWNLGGSGRKGMGFKAQEVGFRCIYGEALLDCAKVGIW